MGQALKTLQSAISGTVVLPEDTAYDTLRQVIFNRTAKPLVIVECATAHDVSVAVNFARDNHLKVSVRSGGHSGAGLSTNDGGLVIDLRLLNEVEVTDTQRGIVRVGAGAKWGEVAKALQPHNLVISSGDTNGVGVGGLTLAGGIGWMVRTYGLSIDNVEAVELVTASGGIVRATAGDNADLFWAVRGGGGNFGVATAFEFRAQPCNGIVGGKLIFDAAGFEFILSKWSEYMRIASEKLNSTLMVFPHFGPDTKPQVVIFVCYADDDETAAQKAIQPLRELAPLIEDDIKPKPYAEMLDDVGQPSFTVRGRNGFVRKITPALTRELAKNFTNPGASMLQLRSLGGAMSRTPADAMAFEHRAVEALLSIVSFTPPDLMNDEQATHHAETLWTPLKPFVNGAYVGLQTDNSEQSTREAYRANLPRLAKLKTVYDPQNLLDQNTNIKPF